MERKQTKNKYHFIAAIALTVISLTVGLVFPFGSVTRAQSIEELNQQIDEKRKQIAELEQQKTGVESQLSQQESKVNTVQGQLEIVKNSVNATSIGINQTETELEKTQLEIQQTEDRIKQKQDLIDTQQTRLAELLRTLYRTKNRSTLEVILSDQSFADFYSTLKSISTLEINVKEEIDRLNALKHDLEVQQENLVGKQQELKDNHDKLKVQQLALAQQQAYQEDLLGKLNASKGETLSTLNELNQEIGVIQSDASALESSVRQKLYDQYGVVPEFNGQFMWPVNSRLITAYYHDPHYPYARAIGAHTGIDIGTSFGTPVRASADGIIIQVVCGDPSKPAPPCPNSTQLALVTIQHGDQFATRYLHLSKIYVSVDQVVKQGDIIGLSGGLPGAYGSGYYTTGAHLHFEVKKNCGYILGTSIPLFCTTDPLSYLP